MNIDLSNGSVSFESGAINHHTVKQSFLQSAIGCNAEKLVENEQYVTYRIRPETGIAATVSFVGDRLAGVSWLHLLAPDQEREWTEELELKRKTLHDEW